MYRLFVIILVICTNVFAQLSIRRGMAGIQLNVVNMQKVFEIISSLYVWIGLFLYGLSFLLYLYIVSKYEVSYIYPIITSGAFLLLMILSWFFIGESFTLVKFLGIGLIAAGIWLLS